MANRGTWKITVNGEDLATYEDVVHFSASDGGPDVQTERLLTNSAAVPPARFERGNSVVELQFTLTKAHADNKLSADFFVRSAYLYNGVRTIALTHQAHDGSEAVWDFTNAEFRLRTNDPIGIATISTGVIRGIPILAA